MARATVADAASLPDRLDAALPAIREAVISTLPDAHPEWLIRMRAGLFDSGPLMVAAIAGWALAAGGTRAAKERKDG